MESAALDVEQPSQRKPASEGATELLKLAEPAYRLALRILGRPEAAEDAVQQAYLNALPRVPTGLPPDELETWFLRVAANAAKDLARAERSRRRREVLAMSERQGTADSAGRSDELTAALRRALERLDPEDRAALSLCYEQGFSQTRAADILGLAQSSVSERLKNGLELLRRNLADAGYAVGSAALLAGLKSTAPSAPAALAAKVQALLVSGAAAAGASPATVTAGLSLGWKIAASLSLAALLGAGGIEVWQHSRPAAAPTPPLSAPAAPAPNPAPVGFVRPEVDPRLAANLDRVVKVRMPRPLPFSEAVEQAIRALPPYETLAVRILPDWTPQAHPIRSTELGLDLEGRYNRLLKIEAGETSVRRIMDSLARQMNMEWLATGDEIVFYPKYPDEMARRLFGAFADPKQPREARRAAAQAIVEAGWPRGYADLLRTVVSDADPVGSEIARAVLDNKALSGLADDGLAAAVRRLLTVDEMKAVAAAELRCVDATGRLCTSPLAMRLFGFLRHRDAVPVLARTLSEGRDVGRLFDHLAKRGRGPSDLRAEAARALGRIGGREAVDALLAALATEKAQTPALSVFAALGQARDPRAVEPLRKHAIPNRGEPWRSMCAIELLGTLRDSDSEPAIVALMKAPDDPGFRFVMNYIPAALMGLHTDSTAKTMQRLMRESRNEDVRQTAAEALWLFRDPQSVPDLLWVVEHAGRDDWIVRQRTGWALARIGDPASFETLRRLALEHHGEEVFRTAAETLAQMRHPDADRTLLEVFRQAKGQNRIGQVGGWACGAQSAETLLDILRNDADNTRRRIAASAYGHVGGPEAWRTLVQLQATEKDTAVRVGMIEGLLTAQSAEVRELLLALSKGDPEPKIRSSAVGLLASHVAGDERAAPAILQALKDDASADVRTSAAYALSELIARNPARWLHDRTAIDSHGARRIEAPPPEASPRPDRAAIEALQERMLDALLEAVRKDPSAAARGQIVNTMHSIASDGRPSRRRDKLTAVYLEALDAEKSPEVQERLVEAFFMRMRDEPGLTDVMLGILRDPARGRKVRDRACQNLETLHDRAPQRVRKAIEEYKKEAGTGAKPAPQPKKPEPEVF